LGVSNKPDDAVSDFAPPKVEVGATGLSLVLLLAVGAGNSGVFVSTFGALKEKGLAASADGSSFAKRLFAVLEGGGLACAGLSKEKACEVAEKPDVDGKSPEAWASVAGLALGV
jgi:hypothetical protein